MDKKLFLTITFASFLFWIYWYGGGLLIRYLENQGIRIFFNRTTGTPSLLEVVDLPVMAVYLAIPPALLYLYLNARGYLINVHEKSEVVGVLIGITTVQFFIFIAVRDFFSY